MYNPVHHIEHLINTMPPVISVGQKIPNVNLVKYNHDHKPEVFTTHQYLGDKKIILFTVPKAFTPVCTNAHFPGFVKEAPELKKYVEKIVCVAVNTIDEMEAWGNKLDPEGKINLMADWGGEFIFKMGLGMNKGMPRGLGFVSKRSSMILQGGIVKRIWVEEDSGSCTVSSAQKLYEALVKIHNEQNQSRNLKVCTTLLQERKNLGK